MSAIVCSFLWYLKDSVIQRELLGITMGVNYEVASWLSMIANAIIIILSHYKNTRKTLGPYRWVISITAAFQFASILTTYLLPFVSSSRNFFKAGQWKSAYQNAEEKIYRWLIRFLFLSITSFSISFTFRKSENKIVMWHFHEGSKIRKEWEIGVASFIKIMITFEMGIFGNFAKVVACSALKVHSFFSITMENLKPHCWKWADSCPSTSILLAWNN